MTFISSTTNEQYIVPADYVDAGIYLKVDPAIIHAVDEVESGGAGFLPDGKIKILFEGHIFHRYTKGIYSTPENANISYPTWTSQHYCRGSVQERGDGELARLAKAAKLNRVAALMSASYGRFQICGFNHALCGYTDVESFFNDLQDDETKHLEAFVSYIEHANLKRALANKDWAGFAKGYNGPLYAKNRYDVKLAAAYEKWLLLLEESSNG